MQATQRVQVENTGDVGTKYSLDVSALGAHFTAFPGSGFLAPNQQAQLEITFHPRAINPDIRVDRVGTYSHAVLLYLALLCCISMAETC